DVVAATVCRDQVSNSISVDVSRYYGPGVDTCEVVGGHPKARRGAGVCHGCKPRTGGCGNRVWRSARGENPCADLGAEEEQACENCECQYYELNVFAIHFVRSSNIPYLLSLFGRVVNGPQHRH